MPSDDITKCDHSNYYQVGSPTLKGKHCLLTSFVKGAGMMEGMFLFLKYGITKLTGVLSLYIGL